MRKLLLLTLLSVCTSAFANSAFEQGKVIEQLPPVLSAKQQTTPINEIIADRLDNLLPQLMNQANLDMWLVINREYSEDRLFYTLVPQPTFAARRTTILVFHKQPNGSIERFSVSRYPIKDTYPTKWKGGSTTEQWQRLAEIIAERDPQRIGINYSDEWALADGLTVGLYRKLQQHLAEKYKQRLVSAEQLVVRWMETRSEKELAIYPHIVALARGVIGEAFSSKIITPGITKTTDVSWYIRERFEQLQLTPWFQPYVNVQRQQDKTAQTAAFFGAYNKTIMPGDVLHTDVGICYLNLCTDTQEMGYVLQKDETDVPAGLKKALAKGNKWQDILTANYKTGLSGNEILANTIKASKKAKIFSSTYTHPLGFVGHAAGPTIGMWDNQKATPIQGDWQLYPNTAYAIEGNIKTTVPEWNNQWVQIKLEQSAYFDGKKVWYLAGRQTQWHIVK